MNKQKLYIAFSDDTLEQWSDLYRMFTNWPDGNDVDCAHMTISGWTTEASFLTAGPMLIFLFLKYIIPIDSTFFTVLFCSKVIKPYLK